MKEEEKLAQYAERKAEIRWVRLYRVPDHSFFSHRRHVVLGKLECKTCHGAIEASDVPRGGRRNRSRWTGASRAIGRKRSTPTATAVIGEPGSRLSPQDHGHLRWNLTVGIS